MIFVERRKAQHGKRLWCVFFAAVLFLAVLEKPGFVKASEQNGVIAGTETERTELSASAERAGGTGLRDTREVDGTARSGAVKLQPGDAEAEIIAAYNAYRQRFENIRTIEDIRLQGYEIMERHVFDIPLVTDPIEGADGEWKSPEVSRPGKPEKVDAKDALALQIVPTVRFFAGIDEETHRAALFLADRDGNILYKHDQLECNYTVLGEVRQPIEDIVSVAFLDLNGDNLMDIILIAGCVNETGDYAGKMYKVGEVLFQSKESAPGEGRLSFYRDWRVNDKLNRFSMNKSAKCIVSFVRDECSTEFLYTATTEEELQKNGFRVISEQSYWRNYEKLGRLKVLPGVFRMADYDVFMIYMINEQGDIVWSFQPMGDYDNLYSLRSISGKDMDGDGMKDLMVLARYSKEGEPGMMLVEGACSIYYQRTGGFVADTEFVKNYHYDSKETAEELIRKIRAYWGWQAEKETDK